MTPVNKFIIKPPAKTPTRFLGERTEDKKDTAIAGKTYTIIPASGRMRQRIYTENGERASEAKPILMDEENGFGWTKERYEKVLEVDQKTPTDRTEQEMSMVVQYITDKAEAKKLVASNGDTQLAIDVITDCVVAVDGESPEKLELDWATIYLLLDAIEAHSSISEEFRLAL